MTIQIWDETLPGKRPQAAAIDVDPGPQPPGSFFASVYGEKWSANNGSLPDTFQGLVQLEEAEQILNGFRLQVKRPLDWEALVRQACSSFERNGFLILVDENQVTELDAPIHLRADSQVQFVKLVPLVGG